MFESCDRHFATPHRFGKLSRYLGTTLNTYVYYNNIITSVSYRVQHLIICNPSSVFF